MIIEKPKSEFLQIFIMDIPKEKNMIDELEGIVEYWKDSSSRVIAKSILDELEDKYGIRLE